jgi:hypothetical protein
MVIQNCSSEFPNEQLKIALENFLDGAKPSIDCRQRHIP